MDGGQQVCEVDALRTEGQLAGVRARELEEIVDEREQRLGGPPYVCLGVLLLGLELAVDARLHEIAESANAVDGCSELVRNVGEKLALQAPRFDELGRPGLERAALVSKVLEDLCRIERRYADDERRVDEVITVYAAVAPPAVTAGGG